MPNSSRNHSVASRAPADSCGRLLWVDDEASLVTYAQKLFGRRGYTVTGALTGAEGLQLGSANTYDVIILDVKLPDCSGLDVLRSFREAGIDARVLLLTAFFDEELASQAYRLGATECRAKRRVGDALVQLVEDVMRRQNPRLIGQSIPSPPREPMVALVEAIDSIASARDRSLLDQPRDIGGSVLRLLVHGIADPDLSIPAFYRVAAALKLTLRRRDLPPGTLLSEVRQLLVGVRRTPQLHAVVARVVNYFEASPAHGAAVTEDEVGFRFGMSPAHLGRVIHKETGLGFRRWPRGARLRGAVRELATGREHVGQIARTYGWQASKFDAAFHRLFGLTPSEFRALLRSSA